MCRFYALVRYVQEKEEGGGQEDLVRVLTASGAGRLERSYQDSSECNYTITGGEWRGATDRVSLA